MNLSDKIKSLPHEPGVYLMRDATAAILYIGKAKNLFNRVGTYFQKTELPPKVRSLIHFIRRVDYIATSSERDALILENRLIKKYQPRYNVIMRDDKSYPYLKLTVKEDFPRLLLTRKKKKDSSLYFGPYPRVSQVRGILRWMQKNFNIRPCNLDIRGQQALPEKKYKSCLYFHIGSCPAPCAGTLSSARYKDNIKKVKLFLKGDHSHLITLWEHEMKQYAENKNYEKAAEIRDRLLGLKHLYERVYIQGINEQDLIGRIESGSALSILKKELRLPLVPLEIEAFDISNIQGSQPVGSLVTFSRGVPKKTGYRMFHIRTVLGPNDTAMMTEILMRRYKRVVAEGLPLPGLVLIDGGKPQLHAAEKVFEELKLPKNILAALAKQEEEIFIPGRKESIQFQQDSPALLLLRHIRDEAHRFAIRFHIKVRHRKTFESS